MLQKNNELIIVINNIIPVNLIDLYTIYICLKRTNDVNILDQWYIKYQKYQIYEWSIILLLVLNDISNL